MPKWISVHDATTGEAVLVAVAHIITVINRRGSTNNWCGRSVDYSSIIDLRGYTAELHVEESYDHVTRLLQLEAHNED